MSAKAEARTGAPRLSIMVWAAGCSAMLGGLGEKLEISEKVAQPPTEFNECIWVNKKKISN
jgi:hypothetical protein